MLTHIQHEAIPSEAGELRDFSASLDFLKTEDDDEAEDKLETKDAKATGDVDIGTEQLLVDEPEVDQPGETDTEQGEDPGDELHPDEDLPEEPWADVIAVEGMSDVMSEAWRRLRLSAPFRPEQYLSWEQSADEPFPSLRIHDLEVLLIDDPYADFRNTDVIGLQEEWPFVFNDWDNTLMWGLKGEPELPDPTFYYRIDGTVMLRRSRFLHLELDIELRKMIFDPQALISYKILSNERNSGRLEGNIPAIFRIHKLNQSRQVKSQRMEYFDSPVLGVLAWITPFETEDEVEIDSLSD